MQIKAIIIQYQINKISCGHYWRFYIDYNDNTKSIFSFQKTDELKHELHIYINITELWNIS